MNLCAPTIVGPLSELSKSIRVQGQLAGSTVTISSIGPNPRTVAKESSLPSSDARIVLQPGVTLDQKDLLIAVQEFGGQTSSPTAAALATPIQPAPTSAGQIGHVGYETHLYECGEALFISGAIPGSAVQTSFAGAVHGSGIANEGIARFTLNSQMVATQPVSSQQIVPGLAPGPATTKTPDPIPLPRDQLLPPPTINDPLKACQASVAVANVFDGATVTITRSQGPTESGIFDLSSLWFDLSKPLVDGETVTLVQSFTKCKRQGKPGQRRVQPAQPVEVPSISGTLCAGSTRVPVVGLVPGAQVRIIVDTTMTYLAQTPPGVTSFVFDLGDPLPAGKSVTVQQERCNIWGKTQSPPVYVGPQEQITLKPAVVAPLYDCARAVFVRDIHPNAQVMVFARRGGVNFPISGFVTIPADTGSVPVSPYLHAGDQVSVSEWGCGNQRLDSAAVTVGQQPKLGPVGITGYRRSRIYAGATSVVVTGAEPGALIQVYAVASTGQQAFLAQAVGDPSGKTIVTLPRALTTNDRLTASQTLCNDTSAFTNPPVAVIAIPSLPDWLDAHVKIARSIIWQDASGVRDYPDWQQSMKDDLSNAFQVAWNFGSVLQVDPVPNKITLGDNDALLQIIDASYAWPMFIAYVGQSLAVEISGLVGWSITGYSPAGLAALFDGRQTFEWGANVQATNISGYEITYAEGTALPGTPNFAFNFLFDKIAASRTQTIDNVIDWCGSNMEHFLGASTPINMYDNWQYRGYPPVLRIIHGTLNLSQLGTGVQHWTAGCHGTCGFLKAVLRTINIPAIKVADVFAATGHGVPRFIEDSLYLSHGDDPYNQMTQGLRNDVPPMPIAKILLDQTHFNAWFGGAVSSADQTKNIGRQPVELTLQYLPRFLLKVYCQDMQQGLSHANGTVWNYYFKGGHYTLADLETMNLWGRMDNKIATLGGCGNL
jgi:hypothetical protein